MYDSYKYKIGVKYYKDRKHVKKHKNIPTEEEVNKILEDFKDYIMINNAELPEDYEPSDYEPSEEVLKTLNKTLEEDIFEHTLSYILFESLLIEDFSFKDYKNYIKRCISLVGSDEETINFHKSSEFYEKLSEIDIIELESLNEISKDIRNKYFINNNLNKLLEYSNSGKMDKIYNKEIKSNFY